MDINTYLMFVGASIVLCIAPGPDMIYLLTISIAQGKRTGLLATFGINLGAYMHLLGALMGLSAILATSSIAFTVVKFFGAMYLVYIGVKIFVSKSGPLEISSEGREHIKSNAIFWQGFISDVLNPKIALFYLAFLPQFVEVGSGDITLQLVLLGVTLNIIGIAINVLLVYFSTALTESLRQSGTISTMTNKMMGGVFVALGVRLAAEKS